MDNVALGAIAFWLIIAAVASTKLVCLVVIDPAARFLNLIHGRPRRPKSERLGAFSWNVGGYQPNKDGDHGF